MARRASILIATCALGMALPGCGGGEPDAAESSVVVTAAVAGTSEPTTTEPATSSTTTSSPGVTEPPGASSTVAGPSALEERRFDHEGAEQVYYLFLPADHAGDGPRALTLILHGGATTALQVALSVDFAWYADDQGSIIALPESTSVAVISALIGHLLDELPIDEKRVYVQGASAGGLLAARVACELSDRVAAVGTGAGFGLPDPISCERPSRALPVTSFIDPDDPYFALDEVTMAHARWAEWNGCAAGPSTEEAAAGITLTRWTGCSDDATVELYVVAGLGHAWPARCLPTAHAGLCVEQDEFDGGAVQWDFFVAHPMP